MVKRGAFIGVGTKWQPLRNPLELCITGHDREGVNGCCCRCDGWRCDAVVDGGVAACARCWQRPKLAGETARRRSAAACTPVGEVGIGVHGVGDGHDRVCLCCRHVHAWFGSQPLCWSTATPYFGLAVHHCTTVYVRSRLFTWGGLGNVYVHITKRGAPLRLWCVGMRVGRSWRCGT